MTQARLAYDLASYATAHKDAVAMMLASVILRGAGTKEKEAAQKQSQGGEACTGEGCDKQPTDLTPEKLQAQAQALAGDNADLKARIEAIHASAPPKTRGLITGPQRHRDTVKARDTDCYNLPFEGGERAEIYVRGDGDTDLDLRVADENGGSICSDLDGTDEMYCRWTPRWTGAFRVCVENVGRVYNNYMMLTN